MDKRNDIQGLRAIAVLAVFLFHINKSWLPGGFVGVDIFFVISGYLITSHMIKNGVTRNSIVIFYLKRLKRIMPALLVMMLVAGVLGFYILENYYHRELIYSYLSAMTGVANLFFYKTSGYFDIDAMYKPLLHTWSLAVELQFYLMWPLVFLASGNKRSVWIVILIAVSFLLNALCSNEKDALFYIPVFRIFEFGVGALAASIYRENVKTSFFIDALVFTLIAGSMFFINEEHVFPYYMALPVVIGVAIFLQGYSGILNAALSCRSMVYLGELSYSIYLYHWPVIVFWRVYFGARLGWLDVFGICALTFSLSNLSYKYVENYFRGHGSREKNIRLVIIVTTTVLFLVVAMTGAFESNRNHRVEFKAISNEKIEAVNNERYSIVMEAGCHEKVFDDYSRCRFEAEKQVLFIGNSHIEDAYNAFYNIYGVDKNINLVNFGTTTGCDYSLRGGIILAGNKDCSVRAAKFNDPTLVKKMDYMVLDFYRFKEWGAWILPFIEHFRQINPKLKIIVVGNYFSVRPHMCANLINKYGSDDVCVSSKFVDYTGDDDLAWIHQQEFASNNFMYIDVLHLLCGDKSNRATCALRNGDELIFYDGDHFSQAGARLLADRMKISYQKELSNFGLDFK
jgi:peptidoglycan/LPS O-acetylase OafA/YrhL